MREECPSLDREQHTPIAPLEMTKEASSFLLLPLGKEMAEGKRFPGTLREGERETERGIAAQ
jgi:hypothetical protein